MNDLMWLVYGVSAQKSERRLDVETFVLPVYAEDKETALRVGSGEVRVSRPKATIETICAKVLAQQE